MVFRETDNIIEYASSILSNHEMISQKFYMQFTNIGQVKFTVAFLGNCITQGSGFINGLEGEAPLRHQPLLPGFENQAAIT